MRYLRITIAVVLVGFGLFSNITKGETIGLDEYLQLGIKNSPVFQASTLNVGIQKQMRKGLLGTGDWTIYGGPSYHYQEPLQLLATDPNVGRGGYWQVGTRKTMWSTGGQFSTVYTGGRFHSEFDTLDSRLHTSNWKVAYSQPLLRNRKGILSKLDYQLADYVVKRSEIQKQEIQENFLLMLGQKYLQWVLYAGQLKIADSRMVLAKEQLNQVTDRHNRNLVDKVDVLRAEDAVRIAQQLQMLAKAKYVGCQTSIATYVKTKEINSMQPSFNIDKRIEILKAEDSVKILRKESRPLQLLSLVFDQFTHQLKGKRNRQLPVLSIDLSASFEDADRRYSRSVQNERQEYMAGINFSYPWGNRAAVSEVESGKLQIKQVARELDAKGLELEAGMRDLVAQIMGYEKVLALNLKQILSAKDKTVEEQKLYDNGRSQLTFVIQSRDNEQNAKRTYIQNAIEYHMLILQYQALLDQLLPKGESK